MTPPLVTRSSNDLIPVADHNDILAYIEDGTYRVNTASLEITGVTAISASLAFTAAQLNVYANGYMNFGTTAGSSGYGIRDNAGTIEFKNSGGSWTNIGSGSGGVGGSNTQIQYNNGGVIGGVTGFTFNSTTNILKVTTAAFTISTAGTRPTASADYRGTIWVDQGNLGTADVVYMCMKDATDNYVWIQIATA